MSRVLYNNTYVINLCFVKQKHVQHVSFYETNDLFFDTTFLGARAYYTIMVVNMLHGLGQLSQLLDSNFCLLIDVLFYNTQW